jgi:pimeloyl-ACP methyl ester carboxylesterase
VGMMAIAMRSMLRASVPCWGRWAGGGLLALTALSGGMAAEPAPAVSPVVSGAAGQGHAAAPGLVLSTCRLDGVAAAARCGVLRRPLDPQHPQGRQIDVHVAVLPALARQPKPDPIVFFAGGPGQSAIGLASTIEGLMRRELNRRDVILIDQRGTGQTAPLRCRARDDGDAGRSLADSVDPQTERRRLMACRDRLEKLPYGDLRMFTTTVAMGDVEAVRQALHLGAVNLVGGSYGTRAALEYLRLYPQHVRRVVLDGVAPPDMALPQSFAQDAQAALDGVMSDCERQPACHTQFPQLRAQWRQLLASLPQTVTVHQPLTGAAERLTLTRDMVTGLVRMPLYAPVLASALPLAISQAAQGQWDGLIGVGMGLGSGRETLDIAEGMHYSVVCSEDVAHMGPATSQADVAGDFGQGMEQLYRDVCSQWPRGAVSPDFYRVPASSAPVLLLSGSADPATPPRHAARVAKALGSLATSVVVPNVGHGVMGMGCMSDVVFRFLDAEDGVRALQRARDESRCSDAVPRPPALLPFAPADRASATKSGARS